MENNDLRKLLDQIHEEINSTTSVDDKGSELLRDLDEDIRALLERSAEHPIQLHPTFVQRLEGAIDHLEVTHPDLSMMISSLLESLSKAGI
jgi:hypothetical protein